MPPADPASVTDAFRSAAESEANNRISAGPLFRYADPAALSAALAATAPKMTACRTCGGSSEVPLSREPCSTDTVDCPDCTPTEDRK